MSKNKFNPYKSPPTEKSKIESNKFFHWSEKNFYRTNNNDMQINKVIIKNIKNNIFRMIILSKLIVFCNNILLVFNINIIILVINRTKEYGYTRIPRIQSR